MIGHANAEFGEGNRGGYQGDFVGVRAYRRGDSAKHINSVASARIDSLIVTERGAPQCVELDVMVDTACHGTRDQLANRIRVAASVLIHLHQLKVPMRVMIGSQRIRFTKGYKGRRQILDALADVPPDGNADPCVRGAGGKHAAIEFSSDARGCEVVRMIDPLGGRRTGGRLVTKRIQSAATLASQIREFWTEMRDADVAA